MDVPREEPKARYRKKKQPWKKCITIKYTLILIGFNLYPTVAQILIL